MQKKWFKVSLKSRISSNKAVQRREAQLENVMRLRSENQARLTDCIALQFHSETPYVHRMIAVDDVTLEIDVQLQRIDGAVHREPGESTYSYLTRIRQKVPSIPLNVIQRVSFLQEAARYRPEKFEKAHLTELQLLLKEILKILSAEYTSLQTFAEGGQSPRGVVASVYQKIMPSNVNAKRRRNKLGGSDGARLLLSKEAQEQVSLLSPLTSADGSPVGRLRRQSESHCIHDLILKTMTNTANYLGFGRKCRNGGKLTEANYCKCPQFYKGEECETKICLNGGVLEKVVKPVRQVCNCPNSTYIHGEHCEKPTCANNGILRVYSNKTFECDCSKLRFYEGRFCEKTMIPTSTIFIALFFFTIILVACVCQMNLCKKRTHPRIPVSRTVEQERRRRRLRQLQRAQQDIDGLLTLDHGVVRRAAAYPQGIVQPYVVRLDTVPVFNPDMIGGVEPTCQNILGQNPVEPPPSYNQAITAPRIAPPAYTPIDMTNAKPDE
ncbi:unnamed protein product [Caenorhabditis bovis]|uniref:EGF-like domain-containing protein n=1 Tax=Caenorhabditis bovis TaxID=2654633 RepID=A0A8S1F7F9_9PELO|nr:unnamed protein product [Caenorhabditis bovis]